MVVNIKYGFAKNNYHFDMTELLFLKNLSGKNFFFPLKIEFSVSSNKFYQIKNNQKRFQVFLAAHRTAFQPAHPRFTEGQ